MQGCRPCRHGRCPGLARAWGRVRPHARRYRGSLTLSPGRVSSVRSASVLRSPLALSAVPAWLAMSSPAPLRSTPSASRRETRRHFVPSRSLLGRSRRSAPLRGRWCHRSGPGTALRCVVPACKRSPRRSGLVMPVAEEANRHAKPSAPRLRARLDAGLGKVRRWAAPLVLARWPRAALPPSAGGRSAGILAERFGCSAADCS